MFFTEKVSSLNIWNGIFHLLYVDSSINEKKGADDTIFFFCES